MLGITHSFPDVCGFFNLLVRVFRGANLSVMMQRTPMWCYILVWLGFLEIVPEEQRTVGSVMLQFI